jgi:CheY-like chemotaxis protein
VELHGGAVQADSAGEGRGATFVVDLPAQAAVLGLDDARGSVASPERRVRGAHVLVVDDDADARELIAVVLQTAGARVTTVPGARAALAALERELPDVLLSDIGMPGEDGYMLIDTIRALPPERGGRLPAVAVTAYVHSQDRRRALTSGYQRCLSKPVDPFELVAVIAAVLPTRASRPA